jgi:hypothetical protein
MLGPAIVIPSEECLQFSGRSIVGTQRETCTFTSLSHVSSHGQPCKQLCGNMRFIVGV